jgi:hypothetical protein
MENKEMTLREASIFTLEQSKEGLETLKELLKKASQEFDQGNDNEGLDIILKKISPQIKGLSEFCNTMLHDFGGIFEEETLEEFFKEYTTLGDLMLTLANETEKGDFTEVGDLLRFDLSDLLDELDETFPKLSECFKNSDNEDLNRY